MRKCKINLIYPFKKDVILIDEEKNICTYCDRKKDINIPNLLDNLELIMASWDKNTHTTNGQILDGTDLEVYYKNNDVQLEYKFNMLSAPSNINKLYQLLEGLND